MQLTVRKLLPLLSLGFLGVLILAREELTESNGLRCNFNGYQGKETIKESVLLGFDRKESMAIILDHHKKRTEVPARFDRDTIKFTTEYPSMTRKTDTSKRTSAFTLYREKLTGSLEISGDRRPAISAYGRCEKVYID